MMNFKMQFLKMVMHVKIPSTGSTLKAKLVYQKNKINIAHMLSNKSDMRTEKDGRARECDNFLKRK